MYFLGENQCHWYCACVKGLTTVVVMHLSRLAGTSGIAMCLKAFSCLGSFKQSLSGKTYSWMLQLKLSEHKQLAEGLYKNKSIKKKLANQTIQSLIIHIKKILCSLKSDFFLWKICPVLHEKWSFASFPSFPTQTTVKT